MGGGTGSEVPRPRGVRIGDVMILIAAAAFSFFLLRTPFRDWFPKPTRQFVRADAFARVRDSLPYVASVLLPGTIACLILGFLGGRSRPGRRLDSPGMAGVVAASCVVALQTAAMIVIILAGTPSNFTQGPLSWSQTPYPGSAVAGTWAALLLGGRWTPARSWVDRLGMVFGIGWIGVTLASWLSFALIR